MDFTRQVDSGSHWDNLPQQHEGPLTAIGNSPAHQRLRACAAADGIDTAALRDYLWRIRAPRELPQLARISHRIARVLRVASDVWRVSLSDYWLDTWLAVVDYIVANRRELAKQLGPAFDTPPRSAKNPFAGRYLTYWAPYPSFWHSHPSDDDRYVLLQAHLLFAFSRDIRRYTVMADYEGCRDRFFCFERPNPYDAAHAVRILSQDGPGEIEILDSLPLEEPPLMFARLLRGLLG